MKKLGVRIVAAIATSSLIVTPVMAAPSVDKLKEDKAAKESEVSSLQEQLRGILTEIGNLEEELISIGEQKIQAEKDLKDAEEKEKEQYAAMKKRIQYMYEEGNTTAFEALVTADNFTELLSKAEYVQNVHTYDREQLQEYVETKQEIADLKTSLEEDEKKLETKQVEYEAKEDELNSTIEAKQGEIADLDGEIQEAVEAAARELAEQQEAERQAQQAAANNNTNNNNTDNNTNNNTNNNNTNNNNNTSSGNTGNSGSSGSTVSGPNASGSTIVARAQSQLGKPYAWGACGPDSFDCSGLVSYCLTGSYTRLGTTMTFMSWPRVSDPQPGDIVTTANHCGIYIGGGMMIHAPHTGDVVKVSPVQSGMVYVRY